MRFQESREMYLEDILMLRESIGRVRSIDIVNFSGYSKPSISRALGLLKKDGLVNVAEDGYITLTDSGESIAQKVVQRHRLLTEFLIDIGVDQATATQDACRIEHVVSDVTVEKIKEYARKLKE